MPNNTDNYSTFSEKLTPAEMNKIHFGGNLTPLTPEQIAKIAAAQKKPPQEQKN